MKPIKILIASVSLLLFFSTANAQCPTTIAGLDSIDIAPSSYFTPNGDGYNDTWSIGLTTCFPKLEIKVFNKWGQLVYQKYSEYDTNWDGTSLVSSAILPTATYYYVIKKDYTDESKGIYTGAVTIIK